ncbi:hypothetical protein HJG60_011119 [Phyllostomus discolor]|uniref:Uncharacterized protein n=1 Tax=Phyllostomus discolor TaxID=89673 RepID=A0A834A1U3_9CHIR|nr:hypothetical protein HJG60_011119 [Phyllostomus discolor]
MGGCLGAVACNPGMYPGWESNLRHFGSQPTLNPLSYAQVFSLMRWSGMPLVDVGRGAPTLPFSVAFCLPLKKLLDTFGNFKPRPNTTHLGKWNHTTNKAQRFLMKAAFGFDLCLPRKPPVVPGSL